MSLKKVNKPSTQHSKKSQSLNQPAPLSTAQLRNVLRSRTLVEWGFLFIMKDYYTKRQKVIREEWFKDHAPTFSDHGPFKMLLWRHPDSTNYYVRYIIHSNVLYVSGDIGEAVYIWGQALTWEWLAGLNLDYFAEKCEASETGRDYVGWDERYGNARLKELPQSDPATYKKLVELLDIENCGIDHNRGEWEHRIHQHGWDITDDSETLSHLCEIGQVVNLRCQGHLVGIQMAAAMQSATPTT